MSTPSTTVGYSYDPLGRRIERSEGTDTQTYHLYRDTDLTDYQTDSEGALVLSSQRGADGLISTTDYSGQDPVTSYYSYNPHGDATAITDATGTVTSTYRYDSFGSELSGSSPKYGYTGKWQRGYDSATQTIQMGAREYDPTLGRFTSADPIHGIASSPQTRNRYPYALNDPLVMYDLDGNNAAVIAVGSLIAFEGVLAVYAYENDNVTITEANEEIGSFFWEGVKGMPSTAWGDVEWFGTNWWEGANIFYDDLGSWTGWWGDDEKCSGQTPPLEIDDVLTGKENIAFSEDTSEEIKSWLGEDAEVITNDDGDIIIVSQDGNRKVRFDINNPDPHDKPHAHVEEKINGRWVKSGPINPK